MTLRRARACALAAAFVPALALAAGVELRLEQADGEPLADALFAAYSLDAQPPSSPAPATMDQRERKFVPQVLVVQRGARVSFTNSDTVSHHVYSFSPTKRFQLFLAKGEPPPAVVFDRAGIVTLGCNIHDWMLGYVVVVETPWFVKSDALGRALLDALRPGRYRLELWHPRITDPAARLQHEIELAGDGVARWDVRLERPLLPSREQVPAFREYGAE